MFFGTGHMKTVNVKQDNAEKKQKKHIASKKEITPDVNNWEHWMEKDEQVLYICLFENEYFGNVSFCLSFSFSLYIYICKYVCVM